jgi:hypothetical protein
MISLLWKLGRRSLTRSSTLRKIMAEKTGIYFCGSIRAGRDDVDLYGRICEKLSQYGKVTSLLD